MSFIVALVFLILSSGTAGLCFCAWYSARDVQLKEYANNSRAMFLRHFLGVYTRGA